MNPPTQPQNSRALAEVIAQGMLAKKASSVVIMDLRDIGGAVADFFVLCTGTSDTQVEAIADAVRKAVFEHYDERPWHSEGQTNREWVLLDYANAVAHIFRKDKRAFYSLETLWGDAKTTEVSD
ncbi:MAG: ribosome silencing factor [Catalinimonas sp.]